MNYTIYTPSAAKLKKEILDRVFKKVDANGKSLTTWQCVDTDGGEKVLVHTTDQWAEKGLLLSYKYDMMNDMALELKFVGNLLFLHPSSIIHHRPLLLFSKSFI